MAGGTFSLSDPPTTFEIPSARDAEPKTVGGGEFGNAVTTGVNAGLRIADRVTFEAQFMWASTELTAQEGLEAEGGAVDSDVFFWGGNILYHFIGMPSVQPFVGLGLGGVTTSYKPEEWQRQTDFMGNIAAGLDVPLIDSDLFLRGTVRGYLSGFKSNISGVDSETMNHLQASVGLAWRTGLGAS
jgi:hypothetical protein